MNAGCSFPGLSRGKIKCTAGMPGSVQQTAALPRRRTRVEGVLRPPAQLPAPVVPHDAVLSGWIRAAPMAHAPLTNARCSAAPLTSAVSCCSTVTDTHVSSNTGGLLVAGMSVVSSGMQQILCRTMQQKHKLSSHELLSNTAPAQVLLPAALCPKAIDSMRGCIPPKQSHMSRCP